MYNHSGRTPDASINFVTCHDGFPMNDVVSYNGKHNDENGENNRDGTDDNNCYNHGYEGITVNPKIEALRLKKLKNFMVCLMVSQGVPMFSAGDEFRRTQMGNNNAYCQDNEISWLNWNFEKKNQELFNFTRKAIQLRKAHQAFRRKKFFSDSKAEIEWYDIDGKNPDWAHIKRFLAFKLVGAAAPDENGNPDNDFFVAANTDIYDVTVTLPSLPKGKRWCFVADTSVQGEQGFVELGKEIVLPEQQRYVLPTSSFVILMAK